MPVDSFVPCTVWDFTAPPDPAPPAKRKRPRAAPPKPRGPRELTPQVVSLLDDRLEEAIEGGAVELCPDDLPCEALDLTPGELVTLWRLLFADDPDGAEAHVRKKLKGWMKKA